MLLVLGAGVLGLGDGGELRLGGDEGELALGLAQFEDDRPGVGHDDRVESLAAVLVGALVGIAADQPVPQVGGAARQLGGEGPLDAVLDVGGGDRGAVLVLEAVLEGVGPLGGVGVGLSGVGGQVGHDLGAGRAVLAVAGGQRAEDQRGNVSAAGGVEPGRVEVVLRLGVEDGQRAALLRGTRGAGLSAGRAGPVSAVLGPAGGGAPGQYEADGGRGHAARYVGLTGHRKRTSRREGRTEGPREGRRSALSGGTGTGTEQEEAAPAGMGVPGRGGVTKRTKRVAARSGRRQRQKMSATLCAATPRSASSMAALAVRVWRCDMRRTMTDDRTACQRDGLPVSRRGVNSPGKPRGWACTGCRRC